MGDLFSVSPNPDFAGIVNQAMLEPQQRANAMAEQQLQAQQIEAKKAAIVKQAQAAAQYQAALNRAILNPSVENYRTLLLLNPEQHAAFSEAAAGLNKDQKDADVRDLSAVRGHLYAGNAQGALDILQRRVDADRKAGQDTADDQGMIDLIRSNPRAAAGMVDYALAGHMGVDKWGEAFGKVGDAQRADAKLPSEIAEKQAQAAQANANANKANVDAQLAPAAQKAEIDFKQAQAENFRATNRIAAEKLNLDYDKLQADIDLKKRELDLQENTLPPASVQAINSAVASSQASKALASRATDLADRIETNPGLATGGLAAVVRQGWTVASGGVDPMQAMRQEYAQLRVSQALKNLPPGPASDKDIKMAMSGFPDRNADAKSLASFLRGMAKLQTIVAEQQDRQADWMAGNRGSLGAAKQGFFVGNTFIQPGTRFEDMEARVRKQQAQDNAANRVGAK